MEPADEEACIDEFIIDIIVLDGTTYVLLRMLRETIGAEGDVGAAKSYN